MTTQNITEVPQGWQGSLPEYIAYTTFQSFGLEPGQDFTYQSKLMGGRLSKGGLILDFEFTNPPDLAVNIQGEYYHYEFGVEVKGSDVMARQLVAGNGITLIFIDESDILTDAEYYCREALRYRDHSRMAGG
tara:strand:- start:314 stop:709 length:396 start_codon:yes stop_codon:yes gene_type:complete